jgi:hypothetical protein
MVQVHVLVGVDFFSLQRLHEALAAGCLNKREIVLKKVAYRVVAGLAVGVLQAPARAFHFCTAMTPFGSSAGRWSRKLWAPWTVTTVRQFSSFSE